MRLLFIYFYDDFGTFENGSIIHLSKKYKFTIDKEKSTENEFYFNKEGNPNFIEDFYSENIDIGVLIGENGTGKSVLLNSIRHKNNDYSICVYEEGIQFFSLSNQKHIFIENLKTTKKELNYIYYTSLIDAFDNDINDKYNISNRAFLKKYDGKNLDLKLSLIENDDIQNFFNMEQKTNYDVEINGLKINYNDKFFSLLKEKIFQKEFENLYAIFIDNIKNKIKFIDVNLFSTEEEIYYNNIFRVIANNIKDEDLVEHIRKNRDFYLLNNIDLLKNVNSLINREINKKLTPEFRNQKRRIKLFFEDKKIQTNLEEFFKHFGLELNNINFLKNIKYKDIINFEEIEFFLNYFQEIFSKYLTRNNVFDFLDEEVFYHTEGHEMHLFYIETELYDEFIDCCFDFFNIKNENLLKFLKFKNREDSFYESVDYELNINNSRIKKENLKYLKLDFDLIQNNYDIFNNLENRTKISIIKSIRKDDIENLYFRIENIDTKKWLLILYLEDKYTSEKMNLINKFIKILESNDEIINDKNIFGNLEKNANLNEKIALNIRDENIINVNADFFDFYKKLIEHEFEPFTYELYPSLSSGQKAILFIFARINDAIQKINQENPNENILILLDEADLKLHLEWQRKFVFDLIEFLNSYSNNKFYVLYATHSPMILSDITNDRVVFLRKREDNPNFSEDRQDFSISTFGANIYDIYADSFFVDDFMGKFAQNKINEVIKIIDEYKKIKEKNSDEFMPNEKALDNLKIVKSIGEPLLKNKLEDEIKSLVKDDIVEIVNNLKDKKNEEIEKELEKYSQYTQTKVLMKLLEIRK